MYFFFLIENSLSASFLMIFTREPPEREDSADLQALVEYILAFYECYRCFFSLDSAGFDNQFTAGAYPCTGHYEYLKKTDVILSVLTLSQCFLGYNFWCPDCSVLYSRPLNYWSLLVALHQI